MIRALLADLARTSLVVYSLLLLGLELLQAWLTARFFGWEAVSSSLWITALGFCAFPVLVAAGGRCDLTLRGRRRDLSWLALLIAWALAYRAATHFFYSTAHDLDLYLDGSHGRFCFDGNSYWLRGPELTRILFGITPLLWWMLRTEHASTEPRRGPPRARRVRA